MEASRRLRRGLMLLGLAGSLAWAPSAFAAGEKTTITPSGERQTVKSVVTPEGDRVTVTVTQKPQAKPEPQVIYKEVPVPAAPAPGQQAAAEPRKAGCPWKKVQTEAKITSEETPTGAVIKLDAKGTDQASIDEARAAAKRIANKMNRPCPSEKQTAQSQAAQPAG